MAWSSGPLAWATSVVPVGLPLSACVTESRPASVPWGRERSSRWLRLAGDSYVVLHTRGQPGKLHYDVFFWLGAETTQVWLSPTRSD